MLFRSCAKCNYSYTKIEHSIQIDRGTNKLYCSVCKSEFGTFSDEIRRTSSTPDTYTWIINVKLTNGATFYDTNIFSNYSGGFESTKQTLTSKNSDSTEVTITSIGKLKPTVKAGISECVMFFLKINEVECYCMTDYKMFYPDSVEPTIINIDQEESLQMKWNKIKKITITGKENWCNTVKVKIVDIEDETNVIFEGETSVENEQYLISCIPKIGIEVKEKIFKVIVTDDCENSIEQEIKISNVDSIPPTPISETEILGDWAKSKEFTFTATDYGIGQVSIAFNDIKDLQLAKADENTYSRDYTFIGDVYMPKQLSVMYKDGLGNTSMQKITIDKIDNTAPSITNAELHNSIITITSHDKHETLGEGSGVVKYRYLASEEKIENPTLTIENSTEVNKTEEIKIKDIYKMKYIYIVAEDYVGNTSEVYEFKVPELKLTATSNPNTSNGKGEIILDWSSYDVRDKYFVIYRKKENQENWETIVNLEQKLTGSTYTDTLANDETNPHTPSITITEDTENNNINITGNSSDNGTKYTYYIEAYDSAETLLSKSN